MWKDENTEIFKEIWKSSAIYTSFLLLAINYRITTSRLRLHEKQNLGNAFVTADDQPTFPNSNDMMSASLSSAPPERYANDT